MINIKKPEEIELMAEGGRILASILKTMESATVSGATTMEIELIAQKLISECGGKPSFLGEGGFPATTCISINSEVVHGVPSEKRIINDGDLVSLDVGMVYKGFHSDMATTVMVGQVAPEMRRLAKVAKKSLKYGIKKARPGNTFGDIGNVIERYVESQGFHVVRDLCGHGIGRKLHEDPQILNYGRRHKGPTILPGMVFCIEPMVTSGNPEIVLGKDKQTYLIKDGSWAAHFEHTLAVFPDGCRILTKDGSEDQDIDFRDSETDNDSD